jgi:15-cis-phytoene synthase
MRHTALSPEITAAYRHCWQVATQHYENFSLGSWLLPRRLRFNIAAIYAFARAADDLADEGDLSSTERMARLDEWERRLDACYRGDATHPVFIALAHTIGEHAIPAAPFHNLLSAFRQDVNFQSFPDFDALRDYCHRSADPVGHLVLYLFGYRDAYRQQLADSVCTGLQLANFWQDVAVDAAKGRVYVPLDDLARFGCSTDDLVQGRVDHRIRRLLAFEVDRAHAFLRHGEQLAAHIDSRLAREVLLFAAGGRAILQAIEAVGYDVFTRRPTLSKRVKIGLVARVVLNRRKRIAEDHGHPPLPTQQATAAVTVSPGAGSPHPATDAYAYCQDLTRRSASNFYYAFRLLNPERRQALYAVYAFCRFVDDIADEAGRKDPSRLLARWDDELARAYGGTPTHPISRALADAVRRFPLAEEHFRDLIRGVKMDLSRRRYASFDELYEYCYLVASTVGLLCIEIFGYRQPSAREYAVDLGVAFQLTNILRDVLEDGRRGRIYLPGEDLRRFGCTEGDVLGGRYTPHLGAMMAFECGRARAYYLRARGALAPEDRGSMAAAEAMRLIYERLLDRIEARHFDVFGPKVTLPRYEKLTLAMAAWGRSQLAALSG